MASPEDMEDVDPGLARERTELAWNRTAISFAALGGAVLKTTPAAGILILAMSGLIFVLGHRSRPGRRAAGRDPRRSLLLITIAVTAVSLTALATTLLSHDPAHDGLLRWIGASAFPVGQGGDAGDE
jgi:uncharacterized membrane protein YidH (DUF202 family)